MNAPESTTTATMDLTAVPVLELQDVSRTFDTSPPVHALRNVDLCVMSGEYVAVVGPSGSGKSTLLNVVGLLDRPTSGRFMLDGVDASTLGDGDRAALRAARLGFIFQSFHLLPHRSALENVMFGGLYRGIPRRDRRTRALEALDRVGIADRASFRPSRLSGGERQRVAVARALSVAPSLLLCDEPTGNLDSENTESILRLFDELLDGGLTIMVITHDPSVAAHARRRVSIIDGQLREIPDSPAPRDWPVDRGSRDGRAMTDERGVTEGRSRILRRRRVPGVPGRSKLRFTDSIDETLAGVLARPARAVLTTLGTVLGLASLVATLGISRTAGNQIVERFDELSATQVTVQPKSSGGGSNRQSGPALPWNVEQRLDRLNGVVAAGASADVPNPGQVRTVSFQDPSGADSRTVPVIAASRGMLGAVRGNIASGRWFDDGHVRRRDAVAVVGADLAAELGVTRVDLQPGLYIGDELFVVIGILDESLRDRGFLGSIIIPSSAAADRFGVTRPSRVVIEVELGAAEMIASQAQIALNPNSPESMSVTAPRSLSSSKDAVQGDVNSLFLLLGLISLAVGAIGIANVTLVTVMERTGEIGLRRALGARRRHIAMQFLGESAAMGLVGGIVGSSIGIIAVVSVSAARDWTPVLEAWLPLAAPVAGAIVGLVSGLYPALRAARMEPVEALRTGV